MCGVVGIFSFGNPHKTWSKADLESMLTKIAHRGPDDKGVYASPGVFIGHARLAVIDLSSAGHQPMLSSDGRWVISFNGEIYNFLELRRELASLGHRFVSNSDTEVLLAAWQQWGQTCIDKLDGIFAFALYDIKERELFLVRDHLGVKPLFYMMRDGEVFFASELMALFGSLNRCPSFDEQAIDAFFTFNYLSSLQTGLKDACQLPAGCLFKVTTHGGRLERYWKPEYKTDLVPWSRELVGEFEHILYSVVKRQLVSDAPLGIFLSGGLDSLSVTVSAVAAGHHPDTFTLGFENKAFDEIPAAQHEASNLHLQSETLIFSWTEQDILDTLKSIRELLADASLFPMYQLTKFAQKKVKVALAGDGGDELLAGYDTYKASNITPFIHLLPSAVRKAMKACAAYLPSDDGRYSTRMMVSRLLDAADEGRGRDHASFRRIMNPSIKKRLYEPAFFENATRFDPVGDYTAWMDDLPPNRSYLAARQYADLMFHLPSILAKVDRTSMAHGLEVRVPLLSKKMVEFCINLPDEAKRYNGRGKRILRDFLTDKVSTKTLARPKAGFLPPVDRWFRDDGPMKNVFGDHLAEARKSMGWLQWGQVDKLWQEHRQGKLDAGFILLGILQFINWNRQCKNLS